MQNSILNIASIMLSGLSTFTGVALYTNIEKSVKHLVLGAMLLCLTTFVLSWMTMFYSSDKTKMYLLAASSVFLFISIILYIVIIMKLSKSSKVSRNIAIVNLVFIFSTLVPVGLSLYKTFMGNDTVKILPSQTSKIQIKPIETVPDLRPPY